LLRTRAPASLLTALLGVRGRLPRHALLVAGPLCGILGRRRSADGGLGGRGALGGLRLRLLGGGAGG
jgi:hypothetical protein